MKIQKKILYLFGTFVLSGVFFSFSHAASATTLTFNTPGTQSATAFNNSPIGGDPDCWYGIITDQPNSGGNTPNSSDVSVANDCPSSTPLFIAPQSSDPIPVTVGPSATPGKVWYVHIEEKYDNHDGFGVVASWKSDIQVVIPNNATGFNNGGNNCTINSFSPSPSSIASGQSATLSWATTNCTSASLSGGTFNGGTTVVTNGSASTQNLSSTTSYTLTATGASGSVNATTTVSVNSASACAIVSFYPTTTPVAPGSTGFLNFTSNGNCTSATLTGGIFNNTSTLRNATNLSAGTVNSNTNYTLTETDGTTTVSAVTSIAVTGTTCAITVNHSNGSGAYSYTLSGPSTYNGNNDGSVSLAAGTWTISSSATSVTPAGSQTCSNGGSITFTLNFGGSCAINTFAPSPNPVNTGNPTTLSWTTSGCSTASLSGGSFSGQAEPVNGSQVTPGLSINTTYTLTAINGNTVTSSVAVIVNQPPADPTPIAENTSLNPAVACGQIKLSWTAIANAASYNIYRSTTATPGAVWQNTSALTYTDTTSAGNAYNYWVQTVGTNGLVSGQSGTGSVSATPCQVNLNNSGKHIIQVNGQNATYSSACVSAAAGSNQIIKKGDVLKMSIEVCNTGTANANNVVVYDNMTLNGANLTFHNPPSVTFVGGTSPSYTQTGNNITFNLGTIAAGSRGVITFDADVTPPVGNNQGLLRLRNLANVTYTSTVVPAGATGCAGTSATIAQPCPLDTGYIVFYNGLKAPVIKEINP
ncbi:MAG: hypothetical protein JWO40_283 [Candidatus Doudnabacteria bacterium]|nr:hypothetical protein [Candidatus Doudnabacteria bacterium]